MAYANGFSAYRETRIKTASQGQLIIMLYDEALKHLDKGLEFLAANTSRKDPAGIEKTNKAILKAQEIIAELEVSLDFEQGGDIAKNLFALYTWFNQELLEANIAQDMKRIKIVRGQLGDLREAWSVIANNSSVERPMVDQVGVNIAG